jgi:hypothetical protein
MITVNRKNLLIVVTVITAALMIGMPLSAAASPGNTPAYLASGSSMNYICSTSGYTYSQTYSHSNGIGKTTISNTTNAPATYYYNVSVSNSNNTVANVTVPTSNGISSYTNVPINDAKYMVPIYVSNSSKSLTFLLPMSGGNFNGLYGNYNKTFNYSKAIQFSYYKTAFGTVKATEYVISEHEIVNQATPSTAASYCNITGTIYISSATNVILSLNANVHEKSVRSGTTSSNETYTSSGLTYTLDLSSTNVVPVHTELTGAYIGLGVAIVLLGITIYYFYGRKH